MMPEGLENDLFRQDVADVIAYLRTIGPPPKTFHGNKPEIVRADEAGTLNLLATNYKIYGSRILFEENHKNLGWWSREDDRAVWSVDVAQAGDYRVVIDYASHNDAAGDRFVLTVSDQTIRGTVAGTGTWDDYVQKQIGRITLRAGAADLTFRSDGKIKSALIDLRGIQLQPIDR